MAIPVRDSGGGDFKKCPPGVHAAVCDMVINQGVQRGEWMGQEKNLEKVYLRFEVPKERVEYAKDGEHHNRPISIGLTLTNSLGEKANLRKLLESWRGRQFTPDELKNFDLTAILGKPCMITVEHKTKGDKTYANITAIAKYQAVMKIAGIDVPVEMPVAEMPVLGYHPEFMAETYTQLPEWLRKVIDARVLPEGHTVGASAEPADFDDDIPF